MFYKIKIQLIMLHSKMLSLFPDQCLQTIAAKEQTKYYYIKMCSYMNSNSIIKLKNKIDLFLKSVIK